MENVLVSHPAVVEAGVAGVPDELRGEVGSAFVVLAKGYNPSEELKKELIGHIRKTMGAIAVVKDIEFVDMLPKTRSGKIMRRAMKSLLMEEEPGDLSTIEEEASVDEIKEAVQKVKDGTKRKEGLKMTKVIEVTQGKVSGGGGIWEGGTYGS